MAPPHKTAAWGPLRSLLCLSPLFIFVPWFVVRDLYGNMPPSISLEARHLLGSFLFSPPEPVTEL